MERISEISFYRQPELNANQEHTYMFNNKSLQADYFRRISHKTISNCSYIRKSETLTVEGHMEEYETYNYLSFINRDRIYYAFILDCIYVNERTTKLIIKIDVLQTYLDEYEVLTGVVERGHVDRWDNTHYPITNIQADDIPVGSLINTNEKLLHQGQDNYIITSSTPLGIINTDLIDGDGDGGGGGGGGTTPPPSGGSLWQEGKVSAQGFRMTKGFEAFAPYEYKDGGGYLTIAYGVTKHGEPTIYNQLASTQPLSEEKASRVSYDTKNNKYGKVILNEAKRVFRVDKQHEFDALVDLAFNCGNAVITDNTGRDLKEAFRKYGKNYDKIAPVWLNYWVGEPGSVNHNGLKARRLAECNMFFGKPYEIRAIPTLGKNGAINGTVKENNGNGWLP